MGKMKIYKDQGHGITRMSLDFWREKRNLIGRTIKVECDLIPIHKEVDPETSMALEWSLKITGTKGIILLSGCNCGYGGEGPHGTAIILRELGIEYDKAEKLTHGPKFSVPISACQVCQFYGEVDGGDWVDYGSTRVQTPIGYGCRDGWDYDEEGNEISDLSNCPHLKELPFCVKHPEERLDYRYGCNKCMEEAMKDKEE